MEILHKQSMTKAPDGFAEECPSYETVKQWKRELKCGHTSLQEGCLPIITVSVVVVAKIEELVNEDNGWLFSN